MKKQHGLDEAVAFIIRLKKKTKRKALKKRFFRNRH